ncbi:hypothetical protein JOD82_002247 [Paenibacillus sp. 1182]|uniref:hypothetical protein n=1 Tax=Paenibacillus sp. 1182 TaxID=2806565 RepID=UPI001AE83402|nr:hypothetical protein [Paenibacillus sp. 1182]MBP1309227.1 hypothetical protein [Paenibacillus sp. 1182]
MTKLDASEINAAFHMRLTEMDPMKHVNEAYKIVKNTAFNIDIIVKWRRILKKLIDQEKLKLSNGSIPAGLHPMIAGFPTGFFAYLFDPKKFKSYLADNAIQPIKLKTRTLLKYVDQQQLDPLHRFEDYDKNAPVIVLESSLFNQPFCISGNLKIVESYKANKGNMPVYYLFAMDYLHLMYDHLSMAMHMFHLDLQQLTEQVIPPKFEDLYINKIGIYFVDENNITENL